MKGAVQGVMFKRRDGQRLALRVDLPSGRKLLINVPPELLHMIDLYSDLDSDIEARRELQEIFK